MVNKDVQSSPSQTDSGVTASCGNISIASSDVSGSIYRCRLLAAAASSLEVVCAPTTRILQGCRFSQKLSSLWRGRKSLNVIDASALYPSVVFLTRYPRSDFFV